MKIRHSILCALGALAIQSAASAAPAVTADRPHDDTYCGAPATEVWLCYGPATTSYAAGSVSGRSKAEAMLKFNADYLAEALDQKVTILCQQYPL
jgi:hypothetical protein